MSHDKYRARTYSLCPICLKRISAERIEREDGIYLERVCDEHGFFSVPIWRNKYNFLEWTKGAMPLGSDANPLCPTECGLCSSHIRDTCCVLLEVTPHCNLGSCRFCFADAQQEEAEPTKEQIFSWLRCLVKPGETFLQLSGGEPTTRDDLPEIIEEAKKLGCKYIQLNSNGIRLAKDPNYVQALAKSGLSFVFLQFDGISDDVYRNLRGRALAAVKEQAIENCGCFDIGVTLVPTVVRGVNTDQLGAIIHYAVAHSPTVRGVHFQPVCLLGRIPDNRGDCLRYTLDELLESLYRQSSDLLSGTELLPSSCDHPLCGFHGGFIVQDNGKLYSLNKGQKQKSDCCGNAAQRNREFIGQRWQKPVRNCCCSTAQPVSASISDMDYFVSRAKTHAFTISAMAFQDAGNMDLERLASCSLHVFDKGAIVPFCSHYLTPINR